MVARAARARRRRDATVARRGGGWKLAREGARRARRGAGEGVARSARRARDRRRACATREGSLIYELFYPLSLEFGWASALNVLRYTPFRAIMATITAMLMSFLVAPWFIQKLRGKQISQIIREEGPESHFSKRGTPTMGGALILVSLLVPTILWADVKNVFVIATAVVTAGYGL